ncbi:MAG: hypothetical protein LBQ66_14915 [Planctomycetaceae bacterium]|jgi:3-oxoacyl-[acyl-carrier-protein] synthase II|nr:hypothetical protein [Planctomycetaceae bacterium]
MLNRRVVVTGIGLISPLSITVDGFWESLLSGRSGVRPFCPNWLTGAPISVAAPALFSGDIDEFGVTDTAQRKAIKKGLKLMSREIQMAVAASSRALSHARIFIGQFPSERVGISFGSDYILTTVEDVIDAVRACAFFGNKTTSANLDNQFTSPNIAQIERSVLPFPSSSDSCGDSAPAKFDFSKWGNIGLSQMQPLWQLKYLPNMPASHIAILNNFHGPSNSITLREASVGAVVGESAAIIRGGRADIMLVGVTGGWLHPSKMIAALRQEELAAERCMPFDVRRSGTVLGDGAAAIVLEEREHAKRRGATIWCEIIAGSCKIKRDRQNTDYRKETIKTVIRDVLKYAKYTNQNNKFTSQFDKRANQENKNTSQFNKRANQENESASQNGGRVCEVGGANWRIGHINAHGLGDRVLDKLEAEAINEIFGGGKETIPVAAAKGFWGNTGASAGMFELIASILAIKNQKFFPTINNDEVAADCPIKIADSDSDLPGDSFIKIAVNPQGHASAILVKADS